MQELAQKELILEQEKVFNREEQIENAQENEKLYEQEIKSLNDINVVLKAELRTANHKLFC